MGGGEVGGVGEVDGHVEEGLGGGLDKGKRGGSPDSDVLRKCGGGDGEAAPVVMVGAAVVEGQVAQDRHGREEGARVRMGAQGKRGW